MSSTRLSLIIYWVSLTAAVAGLIVAVVAREWLLMALLVLATILAGSMILWVRKHSE